MVKSAAAACLVGLLGLLMLGLAGCGRRGDLEVPGAPSASQTDASSSVSGSAALGGATAKSTNKKPVAPKQDFLLDPLL